MPDPPYSPPTKPSEGGAYIITAVTPRKFPLFRSPASLTFVREAIQSSVAQFNWRLHAWAVFPKHYHFIADYPPSPAVKYLRMMIQQVQSLTARHINEADAQPGRQVWSQLWDLFIPTPRSYYARLHYVHDNAVRHGLVRVATEYEWCSAGWFNRTADPEFRQMILEFPYERVTVKDDFEVKEEDFVRP
jgi:putative transposase